MAEIIMPKMGDAMTEGKVVRWYATIGGEPSPSTASAPKDTAPGASKDTPPAVPKAAPPDTSKDTPAAEEPQRRAIDRKDSIKHTTGEYAEAIEMKGPRVDRSAAPPNVVLTPQSESGRPRSSPLARRIARDMGVSIEQVHGSGPGGRVVASDVKSLGGQAPTPASPASTPAPTAIPLGLPVLESRQIPLTAMRRTIAKRLAESTGPIPHFYLTVDLDVTSLLALRLQFNEIHGAKISLNDFILRAVALALRHHPVVNASWGDEAIAQHGEIHIGVAVSTAEGLITPVIRNADQKSVLDIAADVRLLAEKAKNRKLMPSEYQGSTFTISNLGAWGIEEFTAIINPPNAAILAIGAASARAVVSAERQVVVQDRMKVTMSCDHRVVDGAAGADYLKTLRQYIEQPLRLVL